MFTLPHFPIKRSVAAAVLLGSIYASAAHANATIDFGTLPYEPVDGVTADGITFGYTEFGSSSLNAFFDTPVGSGNTQLVGPNALVGYTDGVLTLAFSTPVSEIEFPVALTTNGSLTPGFSVTVFDASGDVLDSTGVDTTTLANFTEGEFNYDGSAAASVAITFDSIDANEFALGSVTVPEPASIGVLTVGLLALGAVAGRRRHI